jgi:zinc transport system substrate-binding protein
MKKIIILLTLIIFVRCEEESKNDEAAGKSKIKVASVNYPLHYFAQRIGGEKIDALYPVYPEGDPAYWQPTPDDIAIYQSADLVLLNGADYAKWTEKASLPNSKLVNTSKVFENEYIEVKEGITHSHGPEGEHEHLGYAFTTWLNFQFALKQAEAVKAALVKMSPNSTGYFDNNFVELQKDLDNMDKNMRVASAKLGAETIYASHPVYQYLGEQYGLKIISEHWEPDQVPTEKQWYEFKQRLNRNPSTIMIWEDKPLAEVERDLSNLGIKVIVFNPCGNIPESGDFNSKMVENITRLRELVQ